MANVSTTVKHETRSSVWFIRQHQTDIAKVQSFYENFGAVEVDGKMNVWVWADKDIATVCGIASTPGKADFQRVYTARKTLLDRGVLEKVSNGRMHSYRVVMPPCDDATLEVLNRHMSVGGTVSWTHPSKEMADIRATGMPCVIDTGWGRDFPDLLDVGDDKVIRTWLKLTRMCDGNPVFKKSELPARWRVQALLVYASHRYEDRSTNLRDYEAYLVGLLADAKHGKDTNLAAFLADAAVEGVATWKAYRDAGQTLSFGVDRVEREKPVQKIPESVKASTLVKAAKAVKDAQVKYHEPEVVDDKALSAMLEPLSLLDEMNSAWEDRQ